MNRLRPHLNRLLLVAIFVLLASSTVLWTLEDKTPPPWDPADHISAAYDYYRPLAHLDLKALYQEVFQETHYYAPLVHLLTAIVFLMAGASRVTGIVVNLLSLAALLSSVVWIDRMLYLGNAADEKRPLTPGLLAALLASCYHFTAWLLHDAFLDYPLTAIVTLSFALLVRADDFRERKYALLFGLSAGAGMLTKQTFAFFLLLPSLYAALRALRSRDPRSIVNLALAVAVALAVAALWYGPHLEDVIAIYRINQEGAVNENEAPTLSFMSNVFYTHSLLSAQMQVVLALLFLFGLAYSLVRLRSRSVMLYLWLASGIGFFSLVANKDVRYTVPALPAAALLSVVWLHRSGEKEKTRPSKMPRAVKPALAAAIAAWALASFFNAQWPAEGMGSYIDTPRFRWMVFARNYYGFDHRPLSDDWSAPAITQTMIDLNPQVKARFEGADPPPDSQQPVLGVVVNLPYINPSSFTLYSRLLAPERAGPPLFKVDSLVADSARERIGDCQYLLVRTGLDRAEWVAPMERQVEQMIKFSPERFTRVASFPIPMEEAKAVLYKCEGK